MALVIPRLANGDPLPVAWCDQVTAALIAHEPLLAPAGRRRTGIVSRRTDQAAQSIPVNTDTKITWLNDDHDSDHMVDLAFRPAAIRATRRGVYAVTGMAVADLGSANTRLAIQLIQRKRSIFLPGTFDELVHAAASFNDNSGTEGGTLACLMNMAAGEEFALGVNQNTTAARNLTWALLAAILVAET